MERERQCGSVEGKEIDPRRGGKEMDSEEGRRRLVDAKDLEEGGRMGRSRPWEMEGVWQRAWREGRSRTR